MVRFLKLGFIIIISLVLTKSTCAQTNSDSLIFIKINPVYLSGLIDFSNSDLLMLKFKTIPKSFKYDSIFCALSKGIFRSAMSINDNVLIDSLSKIFFIYKVEFTKSRNGQIADSILTKTNYYTGYLIPLQEDLGVVTHYILQRWTRKFNYVEYEVTNLDCNDMQQCCVIKIELLR